MVGMMALLAVLGIGCGGLDYAHQLQHQRQAAEWAAALQRIVGAKSQPAGRQPVNGINSACWICLILQSVLIASGVVCAVGVLRLLRVAHLVLNETFNLSPLLICVDCRGPPGF